MERSNGFLVLLKVLIQLLGLGQSSIREEFQSTVQLSREYKSQLIKPLPGR